MGNVMDKLSAMNMDNLIKRAGGFAVRRTEFPGYSRMAGLLSEVRSTPFNLFAGIGRKFSSFSDTRKRLYDGLVKNVSVNDAVKDISAQTANFLSNARAIVDISECKAYLKRLSQKKSDLKAETRTYFQNVSGSIKGMYKPSVAAEQGSTWPGGNDSQAHAGSNGKLPIDKDALVYSSATSNEESLDKRMQYM
ncbi:MAG: hypothetical protein HQK89_01295 [Nitrospirae bacterium]|nr:hypothetical protein [Nitrospirota bacterium]